MGDRGQRCLAVAAASAAALVLPAAASAALSPWLVGASYDGPTPPTTVVEQPSVAISYAGRLPQRSGCHGTVAVALARGADTLQRRTVRVGAHCRVRAAFSVRRDELRGADRLLVVQRYRGRTATARVRVPSLDEQRLGSRGLETDGASSLLAPDL